MVEPLPKDRGNKLEGKARPEKTGLNRKERARSMPWSHPHENLQRDDHGDEVHLESEEERAVLRGHGPPAHQHLQRQATASPCK